MYERVFEKLVIRLNLLYKSIPMMNLKYATDFKRNLSLSLSYSYFVNNMIKIRQNNLLEHIKIIFH